eukprot:COSAG02_NODE_82_length_39723_cov_247.146650_2_plen_80_part_00
MFDPIVAAAISFVPTQWDLSGNTQRLVKLIRQAAAATPRPDLILAPEGVLEGYLQLQQLVFLTCHTPCIHLIQRLGLSE